MRSTYLSIIGDCECGAGDHDAARAYLDRILAAIEQGKWSMGERARLYRLRDKWTLRANGKDARFEVVGTRAGRLDAAAELSIRALTKRRQLLDAKAKPYRSRRKTQVDWSEYEDLDAPFGPAKGGPLSELEGDEGDDETGEPFQGRRTYSDRDFIVPGQDAKGHSHRVQCRVMPAHFRGCNIIVGSKKYPFRTLGDMVRWCIDRGIRELGVIGRIGQVESVIGQADTIAEILRDEQYYQDFAGVFDALSSTVNRHLAAQAAGEARRVVAMVKAQLDKMPEGYWRDKYMDELRKQFGHLIDGDTQTGVSLMGGE
jgi:hypothetical protein